MVSVYELKLAEEKLEALQFLLMQVDELEQAISDINLDGVKSLNTQIQQAKDSVNNAKNAVDEIKQALNDDKLDFDTKFIKFDTFFATLEPLKQALNELKEASERANTSTQSAKDSVLSVKGDFDTKLEKFNTDFAGAKDLKAKYDSANIPQKIDEFNVAYENATTKLNELGDLSENLNNKQQELIDELVSTGTAWERKLSVKNTSIEDALQKVEDLVKANTDGIIDDTQSSNVRVYSSQRTEELISQSYTKIQSDERLKLKINVDQKGVPNGVASLDNQGKVPLSQLPNLDKSSVGLANVDNTADLAKPISTATQQALNSKLNTTATAADSAKLGGKQASEYALKSELSDGLPIGAYLQWSSERKTPAGFLVCDGRSLNKSEYAELFEVIRYTYGGSGESFNIPTFNDGRFMRSVGGNAAPLGEKQAGTKIPNIAINKSSNTAGALVSPAITSYSDRGSYPLNTDEIDTIGAPSAYLSTALSPSGGTSGGVHYTTRPLNSSVVVLIKAKNVSEPKSGQIDDSIYATAVKAGIAKLTDIIDGQASDTAVSQKAVKDAIDANKSIGKDQIWKNVTDRRKIGINYTNVTERPIMISLFTAPTNNGLTIVVDTTSVASTDTPNSTLQAIIPPGSVYYLYTGSAGGFKYWWELS